MNQRANSERKPVDPGEIVYDRNGTSLGLVTGMTEKGFEVEPVDPDNQEELPGQEFASGYLMWRCGDCGEMGELDDGMPETCPNCGVSKEALSEVLED